MTQKDFKAIADIIFNNNFYEDGTERTVDFEEFLEDLGDYFQSQNAKFKRDKFLLACGLDETSSAYGAEVEDDHI